MLQSTNMVHRLNVQNPLTSQHLEPNQHLKAPSHNNVWLANTDPQKEENLILHATQLHISGSAQMLRSIFFDKFLEVIQIKQEI